MSTAPEGTDGPRRRRLLVLALGAVVYAALIIAGLGLVSLAIDEDVVAAGGLGAWPGVLGIAAAVAAWTGVLAPALDARPGIGTAVLAGVAGALAYCVAVFVVAFFGSGDAVWAAATSWRLVTHGFAAAVLVAGVLAATGVAVGVRAGPGPARWPWEREDDEER